MERHPKFSTNVSKKKFAKSGKRNFFFDDFAEFHDEENFLIFQIRTEKEFEKQGYKKDSELLITFENFIDREINHIFAEMEFENYAKLLWKKLSSSKDFKKYSVKERTVLVLKKRGRNGRSFANEKYKEEYEFPY